MDDVLQRVHAIGFDEHMRWDMHVVYAYDREDPFKVKLIFQTANAAAEWREDRHVLMHAVYGFTLARTDDMAIQPLRDYIEQMTHRLPEDAMVMHLRGVDHNGDEGVAHVVLHREGLRQFLDDTQMLIPLGTEPVDVDAALEQLLNDSDGLMW